MEDNFFTYCDDFCRTLTWISQGCTCVPPSRPPLPPPSPPHPFGLSQSTSFECPASCIELTLVIYFTYGNCILRISGSFKNLKNVASNSVFLIFLLANHKLWPKRAHIPTWQACGSWGKLWLSAFRRRYPSWFTTGLPCPSSHRYVQFPGSGAIFKYE